MATTQDSTSGNAVILNAVWETYIIHLLNCINNISISGDSDPVQTLLYNGFRESTAISGLDACLPVDISHLDSSKPEWLACYSNMQIPFLLPNGRMGDGENETWKGG